LSLEVAWDPDAFYRSMASCPIGVLVRHRVLEGRDYANEGRKALRQG
jgi:hypothetical protein